ncbi:hypothetical protein D3C81_1617820 [compost metagenome]
MHQHIRALGSVGQQLGGIVVAADDHPPRWPGRAQVVVAVQQLLAMLYRQTLGQLAPQRATRYAFGFQAGDVQARFGVEFGEHEPDARHAV